MNTKDNNKRSLGTFYEEQAITYLQQYQIRIVERNFRNRFGEIDLIGYDGNTLVFFEVKYRKSVHHFCCKFDYKHLLYYHTSSACHL